MRNFLPLLFVIFMAAPACAHDWCYDRSLWEADVARGRALVEVMDCEAALQATVRSQFDQIDQAVLRVYVRDLRPLAPAQPVPPRPSH